MIRRRLIMGLVVLGVGSAGAATTSVDLAAVPREHVDSLPSSCRDRNFGEGEALNRRNSRGRHVIVPGGPLEVLLCRYSPAGELKIERRFGRRSLARSLAVEMNLSRPAHGTYYCPNDD